MPLGDQAELPAGDRAELPAGDQVPAGGWTPRWSGCTTNGVAQRAGPREPAEPGGSGWSRALSRL